MIAKDPTGPPILIMPKPVPIEFSIYAVKSRITSNRQLRGGRLHG